MALSGYDPFSGRQNKLPGGSTGYGSNAGAQQSRPMGTAYGGTINAAGQLSSGSSGSGGGGGGYSFNYNQLDPIGYDTYTKTATSQELAQKEEYNREREARYQQWIRDMLPQMQGSWASIGGIGGANQQAPNLPAREDAPSYAEDQAAAQASFARAKDQAGLIAQSALAGLRSSLGGRGLLGSGAEYRGTANIASQGLGELGDLNRERYIQNAENARQFSLARYQGGITQRGQDISSMNQQGDLNLQRDLANLEAAVRQRGQDIDLQQALMGLIKY